MNSDELKEITQQLADVAMPPAPEWHLVIIAATAMLVVVILLSIGVIYLRSRRKKTGVISDSSRAAIYQLQLLQHKWQRQEINDHDAAYQLATLWRLGLDLNQLIETPPPALMDQQPQWQELLQQLTQLRYSQTKSKTPFTADAFTKVEAWLKQAPAPC